MVFVSEGNQSRMATLVDLRGVHHVVIPNGVDVHVIARRSPSPAVRRARVGDRPRHRGLRAMTASRLTRQKGLDVLIDAVRLVRRGTVECIDIFGEGSARPELEAWARSAGVDAVVRFRPWSFDVVGEMADHDVFVLPSRHEGLPFVLLESMAAGIPAIATDTPGAVEALDGGRAGTLVPRAEPAALARALERTSQAMPDALVRAAIARSRVRAHYNRDELMARTVRLWR